MEPRKMLCDEAFRHFSVSQVNCSISRCMSGADDAEYTEPSTPVWEMYSVFFGGRIDVTHTNSFAHWK